MAYSVKRPHLVESLGEISLDTVVCGADHVLAMTSTGEVLSWGRSDCGQAGHGEFRHESLPRPLEALAKRKIRAVFCGSSHSIALTETGEIFAWGSDNSGQLGIGAMKRINVPRPVTALRRAH